MLPCDACDWPARYKLTMLDSSSLDAFSLYCWGCVDVVLQDWDDHPETWEDTPGWMIERLENG